MLSSDLAAFVADGMLQFRDLVTKGDPQFFDKPENVMVYKDYCQNLAYVWLQIHKQEPMLWPMIGDPKNAKPQ